jgi:hypothetical protein
VERGHADGFDRGEIAEISGILETLKGKRYAAFAHCFCDIR